MTLLSPPVPSLSLSSFFSLPFSSPLSFLFTPFPPSLLSPLPSPLSQIFEESTKLQNLRLEQQQALQKKQLKELREFAEAFSNDKTSLGSTDRQSAERVSVTSEQSQGSSQTNVSMGTASLWCNLFIAIYFIIYYYMCVTVDCAVTMHSSDTYWLCDSRSSGNLSSIISTAKMSSHLLSVFFSCFSFSGDCLCFANVAVSCVDYVYHISNVYKIVR